MYPKAAAEFLGTFILVSAILFAGQPLYIAAGFLAAITIAGPISGGHLNPAVSLSMLMGGELNSGLFAQYVVAQLAGALTAFMVFKAIKKM
jgi:glycerol uptake facilitator-like aquaporin